MIKAFYHTAASWYGKAVLPMGNVVDDIMIGLYDESGGCEYEFCIAWEMVGIEVVPRLKVFGEAFKGLYENHQDFLQFISMYENIQPEHLVKALEDMGYKNITKRTPDES